MNIKVCKGYVLIRPVVSENKTVGGIILPEKGKEIPQKAIVVSVNEEVIASCIGEHGEESKASVVNLLFKEGDLIIYKKWEGWDFRPEGATGALYRFIKQEDVLGVIEEKGGKKHV
ncbi:MAG: hypothetical protein WC346_19995 [Methanogenium sp.]|jgi:chaperonin GroES